MPGTQRNEAFGRLLTGALNSIASYEGKRTVIVEEELGEALRVSPKTIQRYKAGNIPPDPAAVRTLATAAVRRGFLGREWLQRFLHVARYPLADALLDELCPAPQARPRPPRIYENLPAPTYSQFVMRPQPFAELLDGLQQRSAVVLIVGLGGNGKTSLAREVAARCLGDADGGPRFDAAVWVSDKDRPGTTNLSLVLDEIARTLDYPGLTQLEHEEKRREVEQLLRRQRALLIVDNFETITDGALLSWLLRLPEPSKAIITSREKHRALWSSWLVELRGMSEAEAQELIAQRLRALRLDGLAGGPETFEPLVAVTGGNPKALSMALGLIKHERRTIQQVVDDLHAARGDLFEDLFARAWALLDEAARRLLLAMSFFPTSAAGDALAATADVSGFAFDRAAERLIDLALIDLQQLSLSSPPRYTLHPLVRAFVAGQLRERPGFEVEARERWIAWFTAAAATHRREGWRVAEQFLRADPDIPTFQAVLQTCYDGGRWRTFVDIILGIKSYWTTRGLYRTRCRLLEMAVEAATRMGAVPEQIALRAYLIRTLCYLGETDEARARLDQARALLATLPDPPPSLVENVNEAHIRLCFRLGDVAAQLELARANVASASGRGTPAEILYRYYIADSHFLAGNDAEAEAMFLALIEESEGERFHRAMITGWLSLAQIALRRGDLTAAEQRLRRAWDLADGLQHSRLLAEVSRVQANIHLRRGDPAAARRALLGALDHFRRLGMPKEIAETQLSIDALGSD